MNHQKRVLLHGVAVAASFMLLAPIASAASNSPLNAPTNVQVVYDSAALKATVSWKSDVPAVYGYTVQRRPVGQTAWTDVAKVTEKYHNLTDTSVAPLTRYEYRVKAHRPGGPRTGYISTNTATTPLNFPYNRGYKFGIMPSNYTQAQLNADVRNMYEQWRAVYVTTEGAGPDGSRVYKPHENQETVSEGQGYGMVISVYMADDTNNGKNDFDRMLAYYKAKLKKNADGTSRGLMAWRINADGSVADAWVAPDGDLDAAFALLVAHKKWGSGNGNPDYLGDARNIMNALQQYATYNRGAGTSKLIANGDKDPGWNEGVNNFTMTSYQMVGYMKQFAAFSDSTRAAQWHDTLKAGYQAFNYFYNKNPGTALTPFTFKTRPGPEQYLKGSRGYTFGPDSSRVPWRIGMDYIWYGNANAAWAHSQDPSIHATLAQDMPKVHVDWFMATTKGNPSDMWYTYQLDGTPASNFRWGQRHTAGSAAAGAMTSPSSQAHLNNLYEFMRQQVPGQDYTAGGYRVPREYYGDTVLMMNMLMVTGNMPNLPGVPVPAK